MRLRHGPIYGIYFGSAPAIMIADADMLKEVLVRHFSHFHNRRETPFDDYPLNKALSRLEGARWKLVRNTITPAFSASKMKPISLLINNCCDNLIKHMRSSITTNPDIEVKRLYGNMTMDTIAQSAFGLEVDSQENPKSPFVEHAKAVMNLKMYHPRVFIALMVPQLAPIFNYFKLGLFPTRTKQFFMDVTTQALNLRKDGKNKRVDILQLMADAQENHDHSESGEIPELAGNKEKDGHSVMKKELTMEELMAQAVVFFLAGYETTNVSLSLLSYLLATNPDMQEKLYNEIQEAALTSESLSYDVVNKMEYLEMFVNETLRLYPPAAFADRVCTQDITINNINFTKGTKVFYYIYSLHRDPKYWEDPEKFDPERFSKDNKDKIHPFAYLPFGTGPRNCIGMRFALLVVKTAIARVIQKFRFEPCEKTQIPFKLGKSTIIPDEGITLRVIARE
ncbi:Cytochrome P450 3A24 [Holothuria leucospilota]|uniref:Thromboxane-A synthase n=1 Tax=Holothuria leucospilota TaxID=206669 RepID=A0A9Q1CID0_HOLLE|nr:Cytochrome P450 3A24 [Holothuria leucospilota]